MADFDWQEPETLDEALAVLAAGDADTRVLGGGTVLSLMIQHRLVRPTRVVSLKRLRSALRFVQRDGGGMIHLGALATLRELERSPDLLAWAPVVVDALHGLATPRIRHMATLGGHLAYADPHLDLPPVLVALQARVKAASASRGERWIDIGDFLRGYYTTALEPDEIVVEVAFPQPPARLRGCYLRCPARSLEDWPIVGVAAVVDASDGAVRDVRLIAGGMGEVPTRLTAAEQVLRRGPVTTALLDEVAAAAADEVAPLDDLLGSAWYKTKMLRVHVRRALARLLGPNPAAGSGRE